MTHDDLAFIERELQIKLPDSYKEAALEGRMFNRYERHIFYSDPKKFVSVNKRLRNKGLHGQKWKDNFIAFGYDKKLAASYYFMDVNSTDGHAYAADRTKTWRYNPKDISQNNQGWTIASFIDYMNSLDDMVRRLDNAPPDERSDEEKVASTYAFLDELREKRETNE